jgi:hypothetical protein
MKTQLCSASLSLLAAICLSLAGFPSQALASGIGSIPSEAFDIPGAVVAGRTMPEPSTVVSLGSGRRGASAVLRKPLGGG